MEETLPATKQRRASPEGSPGAEGRPGLLGRKSAGRWFGRRGRGNPPKEHELGQVEPNRSDSAKTEESDLLAADGADMGETSEALQQKDAERAIGAAEEADAADLQLLEEHEDIVSPPPSSICIPSFRSLRTINQLSFCSIVYVLEYFRV